MASIRMVRRCSGNGGEGGGSALVLRLLTGSEVDWTRLALRSRADGVQHLFATDSPHWRVNRIEVEVPGR